MPRRPPQARRATNIAQRESEERFRILSETLAGGMVYQIDSGPHGLDRVFTYVSPAVERLHGLTAQEVQRDPARLYAQVVEEHRAIVAKREAAALASRTPLDAEIMVRLPDGTIRWRHFRSVPRLRDDGHLVWNGIELDITDRKRAEEKLARLSQLHATLLEANPTGIAVFQNRRVLFYNPAFSRLGGYAPDEDLHGWSARRFYQSDEEFERIGQLLYRDTPRGTVVSTESKFVRKDGTPITCELSMVTLDEPKDGAMVMLHDISDRKRLEDQLCQARDLLELRVEERTQELRHASVSLEQEMVRGLRLEAARRQIEVKAIAQNKLATLGHMATAMAHEINQPLTFLRIAFESLRRDVQEQRPIDPGELAGDCAEALRQISRITRLLDHLRTFGRDDAREFSPLPPLRPVEDALAIFGQRLRLKNIRCSLETGADLPLIQGNSLQLEQVFINLLQNSMQAMETNRGGAIAIKIHAAHDAVEYRVTDTGPGIVAAIRERVFDPFFTTKEVSQGVGLGLSIAHGIVAEHGGTIELLPDAPGASFRISIPSLQEKT